MNEVDTDMLMLIVSVVAIFAGILNTFLAMMIKALWGEIKDIRKKQTESFNDVWKQVRTNKQDSDNNMIEIRKDMSAINTKLEVLMAKD